MLHDEIINKSSLVSAHTFRPETYIPSIGVYFLISQSEIVYIGKSKNCKQRIQKHRSTKLFDRFFIHECPPEDLDALESEYIFKFTPKLNKSFDYEKKPKPVIHVDRIIHKKIRQIAAKLDMTMEEVIAMMVANHLAI